MKNVSTTIDLMPVSFKEDGTVQDVTLRIVNLNQDFKWQEVGLLETI